MKYGSVCSGIEAASVAWHPLGWEAQWFSEIEAFPSAVLAHRFPNVPNLGDMTKIHEHEKFKQSTIDVLVGGTPCQSFSVAGLRKGLDDPRGNLMLTFLAIAGRKRPRWVVWENVPGVLSSNCGRDFGTFLSGLAELGYGFAYRVLDAQYFGVAQRRRRVFVIGYLGDWRPAAAVLFERHSLSGHPAPRREKRQGAAGSPTPSVGSGKPTIGTLMANAETKLWLGNQEALSGDYHILQPIVCTLGHTQSNGLGITKTETANTLEATSSVNQAVAFAFDSLSSNSMKSKNPHSGCNQVEVAKTLDTTDPNPSKNQGGIGIVHTFKVRGGCEGGGKGYLGQDEAAFTISTGQDQMVAQPVGVGIGDCAGTLRANPKSGFRSDGSPVEGVAIQDMAVRRLTPIECERLQGFPDNHTQIPYRNKPADQCPDGPRYKACGNSMAVPVMRWIGERIDKVENLMHELNLK